MAARENTGDCNWGLLFVATQLLTLCIQYGTAGQPSMLKPSTSVPTATHHMVRRHLLQVRHVPILYATICIERLLDATAHERHRPCITGSAHHNLENHERAVGYPRRGQKVLFFWTLESSSPYLEKSGVIKSISLIFQIMVCRTREAPQFVFRNRKIFVSYNKAYCLTSANLRETVKYMK